MKTVRLIFKNASHEVQIKNLEDLRDCIETVFASDIPQTYRIVYNDKSDNYPITVGEQSDFENACNHQSYLSEFFREIECSFGIRGGRICYERIYFLREKDLCNDYSPIQNTDQSQIIWNESQKQFNTQIQTLKEGQSVRASPLLMKSIFHKKDSETSVDELFKYYQKSLNGFIEKYRELSPAEKSEKYETFLEIYERIIGRFAEKLMKQLEILQPFPKLQVVKTESENQDLLENGNEPPTHNSVPAQDAKQNKSKKQNKKPTEPKEQPKEKKQKEAKEKESELLKQKDSLLFEMSVAKSDQEAIDLSQKESQIEGQKGTKPVKPQKEKVPKETGKEKAPKVQKDKEAKKGKNKPVKGQPEIQQSQRDKESELLQQHNQFDDSQPQVQQEIVPENLQSFQKEGPDAKDKQDEPIKQEELKQQNINQNFEKKSANQFCAEETQLDLEAYQQKQNNASRLEELRSIQKNCKALANMQELMEFTRKNELEIREFANSHPEYQNADQLASAMVGLS